MISAFSRTAVAVRLHARYNLFRSLWKLKAENLGFSKMEGPSISIAMQPGKEHVATSGRAEEGIVSA
jgi:hypothetical protein